MPLLAMTKHLRLPKTINLSNLYRPHLCQQVSSPRLTEIQKSHRFVVVSAREMYQIRPARSTSTHLQHTLRQLQGVPLREPDTFDTPSVLLLLHSTPMATESHQEPSA